MFGWKGNGQRAEPSGGRGWIRGGQGRWAPRRRRDGFSLGKILGGTVKGGTLTARILGVDLPAPFTGIHRSKVPVSPAEVTAVIRELCRDVIIDAALQILPEVRAEVEVIVLQVAGRNFVLLQRGLKLTVTQPPHQTCGKSDPKQQETRRYPEVPVHQCLVRHRITPRGLVGAGQDRACPEWVSFQAGDLCRLRDS